MSGRPLVLVVDDEAVVCAAVERVLGEAGYDVTVADTGQAALSRTASESCALVLCDLVLPDLSGAEVVRELHRRRPDLPIVVITGYAATEAMEQAAAAGAVSFLAKPFDDGELLEAVRRARAGSGAGSEGKEAS